MFYHNARAKKKRQCKVMYGQVCKDQKLNIAKRYKYKSTAGILTHIMESIKIQPPILLCPSIIHCADLDGMVDNVALNKQSALGDKFLAQLISSLYSLQDPNLRNFY